MYNPSDAGKKGTIFGLPYNLEDSTLILLPVHLDVTVSFADGTSRAPDLILDESSQLDLSLTTIHNPWEMKMAMYDRVVNAGQNEIHRGRARNVISALESGKVPDEEQLAFINEYCESVLKEVHDLALSLIDLGKIVGVVGGDHSSPLGLIHALGEKHSFGILQIDAHMDLRDAYEGFIYSHASIMFNALQTPGVNSLTQVGIRDFCEEEEHFIKESEKPVHVFYDESIYRDMLSGETWKDLVEKIIAGLPEKVYISFDMDGLEPSLCPHTGTPVPGGLTFNQAIYLIEEVVRSGKVIIGFDVCECGDNAWDANVASRIIYRIAALTGVSQKLLQFR